MSARDLIHDVVRTALIKDGWTITHDPYTLPYGDRDVFVDLGAERTIAAEKDQERIVVEIKSFVGVSEVHDLQVALGQFVFYRHLIRKREPDRRLWLAIPEEAYLSVLGDAAGTDLMREVGVQLMTVDQVREEIVRWLK